MDDLIEVLSFIFPIFTLVWLFIRKSAYKWGLFAYVILCFFVWFMVFAYGYHSYKDLIKLIFIIVILNIIIPNCILVQDVSKLYKESKNNIITKSIKTIHEYWLGIKVIANLSPGWFIFTVVYGCLYVLTIWNLLVACLGKITDRSDEYNHDYMFKFFYRMELSLFSWLLILLILTFIIIGTVRVNNKNQHTKN